MITRVLDVLQLLVDELATNAALAPLLLLTALAHPWALLIDILNLGRSTG